jgi:hypothetical protein
MSNWHVHISAPKISVGLELDFIESPQVSGYPISPLAPGDTLIAEFVPDGPAKGKIVSADENEAVIEMKNERWRITRPTGSDFLNPIRYSGDVVTWFAREQLSN